MMPTGHVSAEQLAAVLSTRRTATVIKQWMSPFEEQGLQPMLGHHLTTVETQVFVGL
jgi:hypothetical protein